MSRKMDAFASDIAQFSNNVAHISKLEKEAREMRKINDAITARVVKAMGTSTEATIDGKVVFALEDTSRESTTIALVEKFAPHLRNVLVNKTTKKKIKFING